MQIFYKVIFETLESKNVKKHLFDHIQKQHNIKTFFIKTQTQPDYLSTTEKVKFLNVQCFCFIRRLGYLSWSINKNKAKYFLKKMSCLAHHHNFNIMLKSKPMEKNFLQSQTALHDISSMSLLPLPLAPIIQRNTDFDEVKIYFFFLSAFKIS